MEKKYYPLSGGEIPSTTDRKGFSLEEIKNKVILKYTKLHIIQYVTFFSSINLTFHLIFGKMLHMLWCIILVTNII